MCDCVYICDHRKTAGSKNNRSKHRNGPSRLNDAKENQK